MTQLLRFQLRGYRPQKLIFGAFVLCLLAGCKGSSDKDEGSVLPPPEPQTAIYSEDIAENALSGSTSEIVLGPHVSTSDNSSFRIVSVASLSGEQCRITGITDDAFDVVSDDTQDCIFRYQVAPANGDSTSYSYARVAVASGYSSSTLPRITASTTEGTDITIDLEVELGSSVPDSSFELQEDMVVIGSGTAEYINSKQIRFSPSGKGQSEIHYSYQSAKALKVGTISVSVSQLSANTAPSADSFAHDKLLALGESVVIDVGGYVGDVDGDDVQLIAIEDFNSTTTLFDATDTTNTKFTFSSTTPGPHDVAYTVSDHRGGYTTSVARIEVEPDFSLIQDWEDIVTHDPVIGSDIRLFAPMSKVYADYVNASYTSTHIESGEKGPKGSEVVMQTLKQARAYCKTRGGRLPLQRELDSLITNEISAFTTHNWPTEVNYWTAEKVSELNAATASLFDGATGQQPGTDVGYTTCVDMSNPSVKGFTIEAVYMTGVGNKYEYVLKVFGPDGSAASYADFDLISHNEMGVFDNDKSYKDGVGDVNGQSIEFFYDTSFTESVIEVNTNSKQELYPFIPKLENSKIDITDPSLWNSKQHSSASLEVAGSGGLPILVHSYSHLNHVYKQGFVGDNFIAMYRVQSPSSIHKGAASFSIQQVSNDPNSWSSAITPPGILNDYTTFGFVTHYAFNGYYLVENGIKDDSSFVDANVRATDNYIWFDKIGELVEVYTATTPTRPTEPIGTFDLNGSIDFSKPYWVTFGGYNEAATTATVTSFNFAAY
ncbi:hypothetical protein ACI3L8_16280 [Vibrio campbellii]|uniref:hypothetical protein n=1 Tax=Vibrio campbellii TaxID=680 RepID=UPI00385763AF